MDVKRAIQATARTFEQLPAHPVDTEVHEEDADPTSLYKSKSSCAAFNELGRKLTRQGLNVLPADGEDKIDQLCAGGHEHPGDHCLTTEVQQLPTNGQFSRQISDKHGNAALRCICVAF
ncbi:hypothetical protein CHS0354_023674 [Potamilus streckersoni]|uniref:Uncharacterized protein n=1 Tax=Potamilus streckersoni TaxID=2493646 RepID=A0AAE0VSZ0_9BIVA|nr:hypothetical protein CHS0354_023674 [Potamilus streckersoni]